MRPPFTIRRPMCIRPFKNVPAVSTTHGALNSAPQIVFTPTTRFACSPLSGFAVPFCPSPFGVAVLSCPPSCGFPVPSCPLCCGVAVPSCPLCCGVAAVSSTSSSSTWSCQMSKFAVSSSTRRHSQMNFPRSHCARGLHTAGPLLRFSMRNWMAVASVTSPICPPRASISRTICPLAIPPTAGLHDICAILFMSIVMSSVRAPMLAEAVAASQPACPPPMTITS